MAGGAHGVPQTQVDIDRSRAERQARQQYSSRAKDARAHPPADDIAARQEGASDAGSGGVGRYVGRVGAQPGRRGGVKMGEGREGRARA